MFDYKVTPQQFIQEIRKQVENSRSIVKASFYDDSQVVKRGRSRSISGILEDCFAEFLYVNLKDIIQNLYIFVDQPISYKDSDGKSITRYPDVLVCSEEDKKYKILYMFDLKTNIGWMRDKIKSEGDEHDKFVEELKISNEVMGKDGSSKEEKYTFIVSHKIRYDLVILTNRNIKKDLFESQIRQVNEECKNTSAWVLSNSELNSYNEKDTFEANKEEFDKIFDSIKKSIT